RPKRDSVGRIVCARECEKSKPSRNSGARQGGRMRLTDVQPAEGARKNRKRVGRGRASGHGKTSTRGHNGQGQRSGESRRFGFEGGQTPLFRRLPKIHNFDQIVIREWIEVNVGALNVLPAGTEVTPESLVEHKLLRKVTNSLRILGNGELKVSLTVK